MWFRVDEQVAFHPKTVQAGNAAMGLWLRAGAWSSGQLTDGFIPSPIGSSIGSAREIRALVDTGLWVPVGGGWCFHDWGDYNPSGELIDVAKTARRDGAARTNHQRWHVARGLVDPSCPYCDRSAG